MKKICFILLSLLSATMIQAQYREDTFFDLENGDINLDTQVSALGESLDLQVKLPHRAEDIAWSRVIYRVIDVRYKQNYQLYYPLTSEHRQYKSLFNVMLYAIQQGMDVYEKSSDVGDIKPYFNLPPMPREMIPTVLNTDRTGELGDGDIATSEYMLLNYDSTTQEMRFNNYSYKSFVRNQLKFLIQEVIFFDVHYSRLFSQIVAIAPLHADNATYYDGMPVMEALYGQILFWLPFEPFRKYLAQQYIIPRGYNDIERTTFDEFFAKKLYSSYIVGASNVYDRMIPDYVPVPKKKDTGEIDTEKYHENILKEQERIEKELLNFEQDLWEY